MAISASFLVIITISLHVIHVKSCEIDVNGCSVPLKFPFPYKTDFTPACVKHDVCYRCGNLYGWTRSQCDVAFKKDMISICESLYTNKKRSVKDKVRASWKLVSAVAKWPFISSKLDHCKHGANIYYMTVDEFGGGHFRSVSPQFCHDRCVISKGSPDV